jgi:hypothetical protein
VLKDRQLLKRLHKQSLLQVEKFTDEEWASIAAVAVQEKEEKVNTEPLVDHGTRQVLVDAVIAKDGYFYNRHTVPIDPKTHKSMNFIRITVGGGPTNLMRGADLNIDDDSCDDIVERVVANNGRFYNKATVQRIMKDPSRNLTEFIECREIL